MVKTPTKELIVKHIEETLGTISALAQGHDDQGNPLPFDLAFVPDCPVEGATTLVTIGVSDTVAAQSNGTRVRHEFLFCTYQRYGSEWFSDFMKIMGYICDHILKDGQAVASGDVFDLGAPIADGSRLSAIYFSDPLYHLEDFWTSEALDPPVCFGWMVPITADEMNLIAEKGPDALDQAFSEQEPDLMDLGRDTVALLKH